MKITEQSHTNIYGICNVVLYHQLHREVQCNQQHEDKWIQQLALPRNLGLKTLKAIQSCVIESIVIPMIDLLT